MSRPPRPLSRRDLLRAGLVTAAGITLSAGPARPAGAMVPAPPLPAAGGPGSPRGDRLPPWFELSRVVGHGEATMPPQELGHGKPAYNPRADAYVRHLKVRDEDPWWPSAAPRGRHGRRLFDGDRYNVVLTADGPLRIFLPAGTNLAKEMADYAHGHGVQLVGYYRHYNNARCADMHPEWVAHRLDGSRWESHTGLWLDITDPGYRAVVATHLHELASYGVDALYFDYIHLPPVEGARGSHLAAAFERETGSPPPESTDLDDPDVRAWVEFSATAIEDTFTHWKEHVKRDFPQVPFVISGTYLPGLTDAHHRTGLARVADSVKSEWDLAVQGGVRRHAFGRHPDLAEPDHSVSRSLGWTLLRESAGGRPPHVWLKGAGSKDQAAAAVSALLAHGCIASLFTVSELLDGPTGARLGPGVAPRPDRPSSLRQDALDSAYELNLTVSGYLARTTAVRYAAVHHAESQRDARGADTERAWREVLWRTVGYYQALTRVGLPVCTVDDGQLATGALDGYRLLFLPNRSELGSDQEQAVEAFEWGGGRVVDHDPAWAWADPDGTVRAADDLAARLGSVLADSPVRISKPSERIVGVPYLQPAESADGPSRLVVAVANDFSHVQTTYTTADGPPEPPRPAARGVTVDWRRDLPLSGSGAVAAAATGTAGTADRPRRVFEAVTGTELPVRMSSTGFRAELPDFQHLAVLVAEY